MTLVLTLLAALGGLFLASGTPHMLISALLASTLLVVVALGLLAPSPWLAYILFLIFLGGILILFTYISSLSANHLFSGAKLLTFAISAAIAFTTLSVNKTPAAVEEWGLMDHNMSMPMKELFTPALYPLYLYLFVYLLITLLYVVVVMKVYYAPLRSSSL
uniref:NADH dehydrogenase subunit 6 n=1 Tax=Proasellus margalefi TaxID=1281998 RepID=A0A485M8C3_9CRUS|nr:NADH dehydrogenase subunit 6 [Proasellus margalefi]